MVSDYLLQHASVERYYQRVPPSSWQALLAHIDAQDDLRRLATSADRRLLYCYAEPLYRRCVDLGDHSLAFALAELLTRQGRAKEASAVHADAGDSAAALQPAELLADEGQVEELRARADAGDLLAAQQLAKLLADQGREEEVSAVLRPFADAEQSAMLLLDEGRVEDAIAVLRPFADAGGYSAAGLLAKLLGDQGQVEELRARANAGDLLAAQRLAELLTDQGRVDEAIAVLRPHADAGAGSPAHDLAKLLAEQGRLEELHARDDAGDGHAALRLAMLLGDQRRVEELRDRARRGDVFAVYAGWQLADVLARHGDVEMLRAEVDAGNLGAAPYFLEVLGQHDPEEAERVRRSGLSP
jgi:hypothetical protein